MTHHAYMSWTIARRLRPGNSRPIIAHLITNLVQVPSLMASHTAAYVGTRRKLILAFDIGTTFSGISYRYVHESCAL
jgi:hypothetical protein